MKRIFYNVVAGLTVIIALYRLYELGAVWHGLALAGAACILTIDYIQRKIEKL